MGILTEKESLLKQLEDIYKNVLETISEHIVYYDKDFKIIWANKTAADSINLTPEQLVGKNCYNLWQGRNEPCEECPVLKTLKSGELNSREMITPDGRRWFVEGYPVFNDNNKISGVVEITRDITELKKVEDAIQTEKKFTENVINASIDTIFVFNPQTGKALRWNKAFNEASGYSDEEISSMKAPNSYYNEEDLKRSSKAIEKLIEEGRVKVELSLITKDGKSVPFEYYATLIKSINGEPLVVSLGRDITERKVAEHKLKESEMKYRNILENLMEGYYETDLIGNLVYANVEYCKIMGYSKEEVIGKNYRLLYDTKSSEVLFNMFNQVYKTGIPRPPTGLAKVITKKKKLIYFEGSIDLLYDSKGNKVGFYGLVRNITKRKIAEQKLKKSEEKYRSLFENMNTGFALHEVIVDDNNKPADYRYIEVNPAFERFTGMKKEDLIGKTVTEAIPGTENDPADWIGKFGNVGLTGIPITVEDYSEAFDRWYKVSGYSPKKDYFAVTFTDITERKKAEEALKESEEKFRTIAEQSFMSIIIVQDGILKYFNERLPKVNGYSPEEIKSWKPYEFAKLIHPDDRDFVMDQARKKEIGEKGVIEQYKYRIIRKDGEIRWLENFSKTVNYKGRPADFIMSIDITEQMNAEKQLKKSEKKYREAFNRSNFYKDLIAHDINNILQNILSSVELCFLYLEEEKDLNELKQMLKISKQQVSRAANLISNVRKLSRLEDIKISTKPIEAIEVLNQSIDFLLKSFQDKKINIDIENPYKAITVQANELLIDIFENILINAVKYTHHFPVEIKIKVSKLQKDGLKLVKFEFEDSGIGISDADKGNIFQRVYNIDRTISGMGIGLSLVRKILTTYKGQIWIEDKVKGDYSKGSNFVVLIPEV